MMSAHTTRPDQSHPARESCHQLKSLLEEIGILIANDKWDSQQISRLLLDCSRVMSEHSDALNSDMYLDSIARVPCLTAHWQRLKKDNIAIRESLMSLRIGLLEQAEFEASRTAWRVQFHEAATMATEYLASETVLIDEAFRAPGWVDGE